MLMLVLVSCCDVVSSVVMFCLSVLVLFQLSFVVVVVAVIVFLLWGGVVILGWLLSKWNCLGSSVSLPRRQPG